MPVSEICRSDSQELLGVRRQQILLAGPPEGATRPRRGCREGSCGRPPRPATPEPWPRRTARRRVTRTAFIQASGSGSSASSCSSVGLVELIELGEPDEPSPAEVGLGRVGGQCLELRRRRGGLREPTKRRQPTVRCLRQGEAEVGDTATASRRAPTGAAHRSAVSASRPSRGSIDRVSGLANQHADPAVDELLGRQLAVVEQAPGRRQGEGASHRRRELAPAGQQQLQRRRVGPHGGEGQVLVIDQHQVGVGAAVDLGALAGHFHGQRLDQGESVIPVGVRPDPQAVRKRCPAGWRRRDQGESVILAFEGETVRARRLQPALDPPGQVATTGRRDLRDQVVERGVRPGVVAEVAPQRLRRRRPRRRRRRAA